MTQRTASVLDVHTMHDYYERGYSLRETGRRFYYDAMTVYRYFRLHNLSIRPRSEAMRIQKSRNRSIAA